MSGDSIKPMPKKNRGTATLPFGSILKSLMKERGLTLKNVSELADVPISVVQGWLNGANPHDLKSVQKLARSLGMSFETLLLGASVENSGIRTTAEVFEEVDLFDGLCKVSIKRLVPRNNLK